MQFLYNGGFDDFEVEQNDILEVRIFYTLFTFPSLIEKTVN